MLFVCQADWSYVAPAPPAGWNGRRRREAKASAAGRRPGPGSAARAARSGPSLKTYRTSKRESAAPRDGGTQTMVRTFSTSSRRPCGPHASHSRRPSAPCRFAPGAARRHPSRLRRTYRSLRHPGWGLSEALRGIRLAGRTCGRRVFRRSGFRSVEGLRDCGKVALSTTPDQGPAEYKLDDFATSDDQARDDESRKRPAGRHVEDWQHGTASPSRGSVPVAQRKDVEGPAKAQRTWRLGKHLSRRLCDDFLWLDEVSGSPPYRSGATCRGSLRRAGSPTLHPEHASGGRATRPGPGDSGMPKPGGSPSHTGRQPDRACPGKVGQTWGAPPCPGRRGPAGRGLRDGMPAQVGESFA